MDEKPEGWNQELYEKLSFDFLIECAENERIGEWNALYLEYLESEWNRLYPGRDWDPENVFELVRRDSKFKRPDFSWRDFREAICRGVYFRGVHLEGADFREAHMKGINFTGAHLDGALFHRAHMEGAIFWEIRLVEAHIWRLHYAVSHLSGANFHEVHLENVNFRGSHLEETDFARAHLEGVNFHEAHLERADFGKAQMKEVNFQEAHLERTNFWGSHLEETYFKDAHLEGANFGAVHLEEVNFQEAHMEGVTFGWSHLEKADFAGAHLEGVNFIAASLEGAQFTYTIVDGETLFTKNHIDKNTDFTGTALSATRIDPNLRTKLERNIREIHWRKWYNKPKISPVRFLNKIFCKKQVTEEEQEYPPSLIDRFFINPFVRFFWWVSNYGSSTKRVIGVFFAWNIFWAFIYQLALPLQSGSILPGAKTTVLQTPDFFTAIFQTNLMMFSITDLATEGLDYPALICVTVHIVIGYFILAALITRLGIMFQNLSP